MLIRLILWLFLLSLPLFLFALTIKIAALMLLFACGLLFFLGLISVLKRCFDIVCTYFSAQARENRKMLFAQNQKQTHQRLLHFKRLQLNYFKELEREKILKKNNTAHIHALSDAIERDLYRDKQKIPKALFLQFQRENRLFRRQQNEQALLELHVKISTRVSDKNYA